MNDLFTSPLGALLARPWIDRAGLAALRWYMPLSRLWAAANAAGGDSERFREEVGVPLPALWSGARLRAVLSRHDRAKTAAEAARDAWEQALFGANDADADQLDRARRLAATRHLATRAWLSPLLFPNRPPLARWNIDPPGTVGDDVLATGAFGAMAIEESRSFVRHGLREYWLRGASPSRPLLSRAGSEILYARVVEPAEAPAVATLVFGNGLCQEFELLPIGRDAGRRLAELGWRVIEPISPYHGLRAMPGFYGGEPFFAAAPSAALDLVVGQALEAAHLMAWSRGRFGGPLALAGISLTSFVTQLVASVCDRWPAEARPDAAMLISHAGRIEDVTFGGALATTLGFAQALIAAGWSRADLARLARAIDPAPEPALPPSRIVSVLGETDRWLPYGDGVAVARQWALPEENIFRYRLGHLGMPVQLLRDSAPFERLRRVLAE
jgi:hypothetical protein